MKASSLLLLTLEIYHMMNKEVFDLISNTPQINKCSKRHEILLRCELLWLTLKTRVDNLIDIIEGKTKGVIEGVLYKG